MNERHKELELEAAYGNIDPNGPFTAEEFNQFTAKFAELIVRECLDIVANADMSELEGPDPEDVLYVACKQIKEHFGVG
jgi:hypothetical protein